MSELGAALSKLFETESKAGVAILPDDVSMAMGTVRSEGAIQSESRKFMPDIGAFGPGKVVGLHAVNSDAANSDDANSSTCSSIGFGRAPAAAVARTSAGSHLSYNTANNETASNDFQKVLDTFDGGVSAGTAPPYTETRISTLVNADAAGVWGNADPVGNSDEAESSAGTQRQRGRGRQARGRSSRGRRARGRKR